MILKGESEKQEGMVSKDMVTVKVNINKPYLFEL